MCVNLQPPVTRRLQNTAEAAIQIRAQKMSMHVGNPCERLKLIYTCMHAADKGRWTDLAIHGSAGNEESCSPFAPSWRVRNIHPTTYPLLPTTDLSRGSAVLLCMDSSS